MAFDFIDNKLQELIDDAARKADQFGLTKGGRNDERDAFRHAYISAIYARRYGKTIAFELGEYNERKGDAHGQPIEEKFMDQKNNRIGIELGQVAESDEDAAFLVYKALKNGVLTIFPAPSPTPSDNDSNYSLPGTFTDPTADNPDFFSGFGSSEVDSSFFNFDFSSEIFSNSANFLPEHKPAPKPKTAAETLHEETKKQLNKIFPHNMPGGLIFDKLNQGTVFIPTGGPSQPSLEERAASQLGGLIAGQIDEWDRPESLNPILDAARDALTQIFTHGGMHEPMVPSVFSPIFEDLPFKLPRRQQARMIAEALARWQRRF